jgi:hypothetical protein
VADLSKLKRIVDIEYNDITRDSSIHHDKLRVFIRDGSIVDIWFSKKISGRFSYHWERRQIDGGIYRHDNFPDPRWKEVATFPNSTLKPQKTAAATRLSPKSQKTED